MANMWELPEITANPKQQALSEFRHSITDTDYDVSVIAAPPALIRSLDGNARWFTRPQWQKLALTGLTRKVLRRLAPES